MPISVSFKPCMPSYNKKNNNLQQAEVSFGSNPIPTRFRSKSTYYLDPKTSELFRSTPTRSFDQTLIVLRQVFNKVRRPKTLVVGVGKAQEPFSYLAVAKDFAPEQPLGSTIEMHCVDTQNQITREALDKYSQLKGETIPDFARKSIETGENGVCKIKQELVDHLANVFSNPSRSHWQTKIEDFAKTAPKSDFDIVSINNVIYLIELPIELKIQLIKDLAGMLKPGGVLITDSFQSGRMPQNMREIGQNTGLWQKFR